MSRYYCCYDTFNTTSGLKNDLTYSAFQQRANKVKDNLIRFLLDAKSDGKSVAGYGAAAKGNTLLNYAGIRKDLVSFICDASESKIGKFMPASQIPILHPSVLEEKRPDYLIIFPWNIANEVILQNKKILLLQRSNYTENYAGFWGCPGGRAEIGETAEQNVIREVKEECNLDFSPTKIIKTERQRIIETLKKFDAFEVFDSKANFVLFDAHSSYKRVFSALAEQGISIRKLGKIGTHADRITLSVTSLKQESLAQLGLGIAEMIGNLSIKIYNIGYGEG